MDNKNGIVLSNKNYELLFNLNKVIKGKNVFIVTTKDYDEFFVKIKEFNPLFIIIDMDSIIFPYEMLKIFTNKKIVNVSNVFLFSSKSFYDLDGLVDINYSSLNKILDCNKQNSDIARSTLYSEHTSERINKLLLAYGFSTRHLGYVYIKEILLDLLINNSNIKSFNTMVYPRIAFRFATTVSSVERNVRNAIMFAYKNKKELLDEVFLKNKNPSIREVLFYLMDKLMIENKAI